MEKKRVSNHVSSGIKLIEESDKRPIRCGDIFPSAYCHCLLIGGTNSGKTHVCHDLLDMSIGPATNVHIFSTTADSDLTMRSIIKELEDDEVPTEVLTGIIDDETDENYLRSFIKMKEAEDREKNNPDKKTQGPVVTTLDNPPDGELANPGDADPYIPIEHIVLIDDMSETLNNRWVSALLKKARHYKCRVIVSTQSLTDVTPGSWDQFRIVILMPGLNKERLLDIYKRANVHCDKEVFLALYKDATDPDIVKYGFLCYSNRKFRCKFNDEYII